jgi:hypothetical protein
MKRRIRVAAASSLLALAALGLIACGGDDEDGTTEATVSPETTTEAQVPADTTLPPKPSPELVQALRRDANTWHRSTLTGPATSTWVSQCANESARCRRRFRCRSQTRRSRTSSTRASSRSVRPPAPST